MITVKKINPINNMMFLYILSLYLFTYREGFTYISNSIALILMGAIWINFAIMRQNLVMNRMLICFLIFTVLCAASSFVAIDSELVFSKVITMVLVFILMLSIVNYIDTIEKLRKVFYYFVYSGLIAAAYIIINTDFTKINRFGELLGNVNIIGIIIGISATFSFYFIITEKKYLHILFLVVMIPIILITGSRKSLLFVILNFIIILFLKNSRSFKKILKFIILSLFILLLSFYLIYNVEFFYLIIGTRMDNFFNFITGKGTIEESLNMRSYMVEFGLQVFRNRPWFGYGIDNYRVLLGREIGSVTYAHNNFIELMVGMGIFGLISYYLTHYYVLKSLIKTYITYPRRTIYYPFIAIVISYSLLAVSMVYYDDKQISIILAIGSVIYRIIQKDKSDDSIDQYKKGEV